MTDDRGQLVVLAAAALALALVPMALAYLQLGYHAESQSADERTTLTDVDRPLSRTLVEASNGVPGVHGWDDRSAAVSTVRQRLNSSLQTLRRSGLERGSAVRISYNGSRAQAWVSANCPGGPDRAFGSCRADRGVVVQNRSGSTHVLAVAVDISITAQSGDRETTRILTAPAAGSA